jgi:hypothetical protein
MSELFLFTPRTNIQEALELDAASSWRSEPGIEVRPQRRDVRRRGRRDARRCRPLTTNLPLDRILLTLNELRIPRKPGRARRASP